jgi:hypothetical protein
MAINTAEFALKNSAKLKKKLKCVKALLECGVILGYVCLNVFLARLCHFSLEM